MGVKTNCGVTVSCDVPGCDTHYHGEPCEREDWGYVTWMCKGYHLCPACAEEILDFTMWKAEFCAED